jgi:hypothetical protein
MLHRMIFGVFSSTIGAVFRVTLFSNMSRGKRIGEPWPEPSRVEWEDTQ